jgi:prolyl-tRNA synthetase
MKLTRAFWQTYKEDPADAEIPSHRLMMRAGLIHKVGAGIYNYLPMGYRTIRKIEQVVREEMDRAGCHELLMSVVTPGELWQESGRWSSMGGEMLTFKDKGERDLCISPTNEETVTDIFRKTVKSYKDLPVTLYQINTKFRDEIRPRFGLMRGREFTMKDAYSFHMDKECLDRVYEDLYQAYTACFNRMGLKFRVVEADGGVMASADSKNHEFQVLAETGEDQIVSCDQTGYAANIEKAQTKRADSESKKTKEVMAEVATPSMQTIEDVCRFLKAPQFQSLKSLVYKAIIGDEEKIILALLLGDDSLNELKLKNFMKADHLVALQDHELTKQGFLKGFIGPVELNINGVVHLYDEAIDPKGAYIVGANKKDTHYQNFIPERDAKEITRVDLRLAKAGDLSLEGGFPVNVTRGIEVGHIFQLGDKYTKALNVKILDKNGKLATPLMGCYGIGITRVAAAAIEQNHDEKGIIWPKSIAPYHMTLAFIGKSPELLERAQNLYQELMEEGFEVLFDDRNVGPGFKFKDAELLGLPLTVVLGEKVFLEEGMLEIRERKSGLAHKVKPEDLMASLKKIWAGIE